MGTKTQFALILLKIGMQKRAGVSNHNLGSTFIFEIFLYDLHISVFSFRETEA